MKTDTEGLVNRYMKELERELRTLPRARKREVVDDVRAHIAEARAESGSNELALRDVLDRLGEPADIAAEARERFGIKPAKVGFIEIAALILLPVGGLVIPFVGWIVGVVMLWTSSAWITRDKVIGTLVAPGGLMSPFLLLFIPMSSCFEATDGRGRVIESTCPPGPGAIEQLGLWLLMAFLVIGPIASAIYLGVRLRRRAAPVHSARG